MPTDQELIVYAETLMMTARPPLRDLLRRFVQLASKRFDKKAYQRDYMRKWRAKRHKVTA
jgi:hypothetical protein